MTAGAAVIAGPQGPTEPGPQSEPPIEELPTLGHARVRPKVIEGQIKKRRFCPETGRFIAELLLWTDEAGETHHRWFAEGELEAVEIDGTDATKPT